MGVKELKVFRVVRAFRAFRGKSGVGVDVLLWIRHFLSSPLSCVVYPRV
jgi:hypothetical protein